MARRAFISFDYDNDNDARLKDPLVGQAKNSAIPFVIADWSIKEPSADWKDKARWQIRASGPVIVLCGKNMWPCPRLVDTGLSGEVKIRGRG